MEMNLQNTKLDLIQWLASIEDKSLLQKIIDLRNQQTKDWWGTVSELEKSSIEKGILDSKKGNINSHSEARKIYEKWL